MLCFDTTGPYLREYGVNGAALMPAAASLEAAHVALCASEVSSGFTSGAASALTGVAVVRPLVLSAAASGVVLAVTKSAVDGAVDVAYRVTGGDAKGQTAPPPVVVRASSRRVILDSDHSTAASYSHRSAAAASIFSVTASLLPVLAPSPTCFAIVASSGDSSVPASSSSGFTVPPAVLDASLHLMAAGEKQQRSSSSGGSGGNGGNGGNGTGVPSAPRVPAGAGAYFVPTAFPSGGTAAHAIAQQLYVNERGTAAVSEHVLVLRGAKVGRCKINLVSPHLVSALKSKI